MFNSLQANSPTNLLQPISKCCTSTKPISISYVCIHIYNSCPHLYHLYIPIYINIPIYIPYPYLYPYLYPYPYLYLCPYPYLYPYLNLYLCLDLYLYHLHQYLSSSFFFFNSIIGLKHLDVCIVFCFPQQAVGPLESRVFYCLFVCLFCFLGSH